MINQHTTTALKKLNLYGIDISGYVENLRPVFVKLEAFELNMCKLGRNSREMFDQAFPKLEQAQLRWCNVDPNIFDDSILEYFIIKNPQLKVLALRNEDRKIKSANFIHSIGQNLSNLIELEIDFFHGAEQFEKYVYSLGKLRSLKVMKFSFHGL